MQRVSDLSVTRRDTFTFLVCVALAVAALAMPAPWAQGLSGALRGTVLWPLITVQRIAEDGRTSRARMQAALAARDSAALAATRLPELEEENARLRRLLALGRRLPIPFVGAEVLHQGVPTEGRSMLLSVGRNQGVEPYDVVIAPNGGLVGVVARVGAQVSVVNTWAHPEFRASGSTLQGQVFGIVAPSASTLATDAYLEFRGIAYRDTLPVGTMVVTAGRGDVYPRGIPIGRVVDVRTEHLGIERIFQLVPSVNPGYVSHVLILRAPEGRDLSSLLADSLP